MSRSEALRGDLLNQIIFRLVNSDLVVGDLTDSNPNVYWELGIRQSFRNGTITIREDGYDLPFDLSRIGTLTYYPKSHTKNESFRRQLKKSIRDCCDNPSYPDSYILEVISGRGSIYEIINKEEISRKIQGLRYEYLSNRKIFDEIYKDIDKNKKLRDEATKNPKNSKGLLLQRRFTTRQMRISSIELLVVTRYLNEKQKIYALYEGLSTLLAAINAKIIDWAESIEWTERWFERNREHYIKVFHSYNISTNNLLKKCTHR